MENAIHVGNKVDKTTSANLKEIIETIFRVGYETKMDQSTIVAAIEMIGSVTEVKQVSISHSTFSGDKVVHMDED